MASSKGNITRLGEGSVFLICGSIRWNYRTVCSLGIQPPWKGNQQTKSLTINGLNC